MKKLIAFTSLVCFWFSSLCQDPEFGNVSLELFSKKNEKFPDAEAIVLFDRGVTAFYEDGGYNIRFTRTKRIKILKKSGYEWANVSIPYYTDGYGKTERVYNIQAYSYNLEDGKIIKTKLDPADVFKEKVTDLWSQLKFAFPKVKEGTIVEFQYIHETPFLTNLPDWEFQSRIPTLSSEYEVAIIPFYDYVFIAQGMSRFGKSKNFQRKFTTLGSSHSQIELKENVFQYGMYNVPAFESEDFITSIDDYIMKIDFQLSQVNSLNGSTQQILTTYPKLIDDLLKYQSYGKFLKQVTKQSGAMVQGLNLGGQAPVEKIKKITDFVKKEFTWNGYQLRFTRQNAKSLLTTKSGNTTEINLLLVGMLRNAGIEAFPVFLSTRDHGKIKRDYPFEQFFNYTIGYAKVGQAGVLLDATEDLLPFDRIPTRCFNDQGLIIKDNDEQWVDLSHSVISNEINNITIKLEDENATGSLLRITTDYKAFHLRKKYKDNQSSLAQLLGTSFDEITSIKTRNYDNPDKQYIVGIDGTLELEDVGEQILVQPFIGIAQNTNLLTAKKRNYPVDMVYRSNTEYNSTLTIDDTYKVTVVPEAYSLNNDLAEIKFSATTKDNTVTCKGKITFKKDIYQPGEYSRIKYYFDQIVKYFNSPIVLEKVQ